MMFVSPSRIKTVKCKVRRRLALREMPEVAIRLKYEKFFFMMETVYCTEIFEVIQCRTMEGFVNSLYTLL
jgi:hypothetical protein